MMRDRVEYELPLGPLGDMAHRIFVKRRLQDIFTFRFNTLQKMFPVRTHH
jgi:ligand-binding SRPBCC domain-containing protein